VSRRIETGKCTDCVFSDTGSGGYLLCRRLAPTPIGRQLVALADDGYEVHRLAAWPEVRPRDWCGEFIHWDSEQVDHHSGKAARESPST